MTGNGNTVRSSPLEGLPFDINAMGQPAHDQRSGADGEPPRGLGVDPDMVDRLQGRARYVPEQADGVAPKGAAGAGKRPGKPHSATRADPRVRVKDGVTIVRRTVSITAEVDQLIDEHMAKYHHGEQPGDWISKWLWRALNDERRRIEARQAERQAPPPKPAPAVPAVPADPQSQAAVRRRNASERGG